MSASSAGDLPAVRSSFCATMMSSSGFMVKPISSTTALRGSSLVWPSGESIASTIASGSPDIFAIGTCGPMLPLSPIMSATATSPRGARLPLR